MTYVYQIISTGKTLEVEQRISEDAHTVLEVDGEMVSVKRLISAAPGFNLVSGPAGGWAESGYGHKPHELDAMRTLGRPLTKAAK
jgi:hypothetical protein